MIIVHGMPLFVDCMDSNKLRNHEFSDYLSLDMYVLTTAGYHEITYPRIYFILTQTTTIVLSQQLLYIIEFVIILDIAEMLLVGR